MLLVFLSSQAKLICIALSQYTLFVSRFKEYHDVNVYNILISKYFHALYVHLADYSWVII